MEESFFLKRYYDREISYNANGMGSFRIDQTRTVALTCDAEKIDRFDTQVAIITAANLFGRMCQNVVLSFGDVEIHKDLPWAGNKLHTFLLCQMNSAFPYGNYQARSKCENDFQIHFGTKGNGFLVDGSGWNSYIGASKSKLTELPDGNSFGTAFSVILAAAQFYRHPFEPIIEEYSCNTLNWNSELTDVVSDFRNLDFGNIFFVGLGSVGSSSLYYLTLNSRQFMPTLIDMKKVKIHNLSRSPIFASESCKDEHINIESNEFKVDAVEKFLIQSGLPRVEAENVELKNSKKWNEREIGTPDIVVPAANEGNANYCIEAGYPPIQLYASTGKDWQITLWRHRPSHDVCSLCIFPPEDSQSEFVCATDSQDETAIEPINDAALPFLSFGAGLMTASEIAKLNLPNFPYSHDRVYVYLYGHPQVLTLPISHRLGCFCEQRDSEMHRKIVESSRYSYM